MGKLAVFFLSLAAGKKKKAKELSCSGKKDEDEEKKDIFPAGLFFCESILGKMIFCANKTRLFQDASGQTL